MAGQRATLYERLSSRPASITRAQCMSHCDEWIADTFADVFSRRYRPRVTSACCHATFITARHTHNVIYLFAVTAELRRRKYRFSSLLAFKSEIG